ncbi:MAG: endonuclease domain-containing protein [Gammaproteobacteria bacterium]|nr:endonuclease domain-containing protein [Gammaproteobacteria bacterium]MCW8983152.1 endonuclease domain-containing protein [Gammaproteobacteria bacterium]
MRLKQSEIKQYREALLKEQKYKCPLCNTRILKSEATLDHDHETGKIRQVLHRSCNQSEGRILSWANRSRGKDPKEFVRNLVKYWEVEYSGNPDHPQHLSESERELAALKRKLKRLKSPAAKRRTETQIARVKKEIERSRGSN